MKTFAGNIVAGAVHDPAQRSGQCAVIRAFPPLAAGVTPADSTLPGGTRFLGAVIGCGIKGPRSFRPATFSAYAKTRQKAIKLFEGCQDSTRGAKTPQRGCGKLRQPVLFASTPGKNLGGGNFRFLLSAFGFSRPEVLRG